MTAWPTMVAQTPSRGDGEASAVIRAALDSLYRTNGPAPKTVLLFDSLMRPSSLLNGAQGFSIANYPNVDSTTLADFIARALPFLGYEGYSYPGAPYPKGFNYPGAIFKSVASMEAVSPSSTPRLTGGTEYTWEAIVRKYPAATGITALSIPGFNRDKTESIIWVRHSCGLDCYSDEVMQLKKSNGRWQVVDRIMNHRGKQPAIGSLRYLGADAHLGMDARRERAAPGLDAADSVRRAKNPAVVTGILRNGLTGGGIAGVRVVYLRFSPEPLDSSLSTTTNRRGEFTFRNPKPGLAYVYAQCGKNPYPDNQIAGSGVQVLPGAGANVELKAESLSRCWNSVVPALASGELRSPRYTESGYPTDIESQVYRAVIKEFSARGEILVEATTRRRCGRTHRCAPLNGSNLVRDGVIDSVLIGDFKQRSMHEDPLNPNAMSRLGVRLLPEGERTYLIQQSGGMTGSYVEFPEYELFKSLKRNSPHVKTILALSHAGFSRDSNQAIVEVLPQIDREYPEEDVLLLERHETEWRVVRHHLEKAPVSGALINGSCVAVTPGDSVPKAEVSALRGIYDFQLVASGGDGKVQHWSKSFDPDASQTIQLDGFNHSITIYRIEGDMLFGQWTYGGGGYLMRVENGHVVPDEGGHFCAKKR